uniref:rRNA N-glycosylase n=1 Tax=Oryza meridionalis TaxID=40149 RepID=A0A0E0EPU7_9ORYZ
MVLHACCSAARAGMASSISGAEHLDCEAQHDSFVDRRSEDDTVYVNCEARRSIRDEDLAKRKSGSTSMARSLVLRNTRSSSAGYSFFAPGMLGFRRYMSSIRETLGGAYLELPTPRNTMTFSLDGSPQEVLNNYKRLINEIRLWSYWNGLRVDVSPLYGKKKFVYTTAERGSLYLAVKERTNSAVFVIEGRGLWLKGFWTKNGLYEMLPNAHEDSFIDHPRCKFLRFEGNYISIGAGEPGRTEIGLHKLRKALHSVIQYRGVSPEPEHFRTSINLFIQYLCEAPKLDSNPVIFPENRLTNCDMGMPMDLCNMARVCAPQLGIPRFASGNTDITKRCSLAILGS